MTAYTFSKLPTANFNTTPPSIARSATGSVYDIADTGFTTPLNMTLVVGGAVVTTISSDSLGFLPDFTLDGRVNCVWKQSGSTFATTLTTSDPIPGPAGAPGPNTVPTQAAIQSEVTTAGTPTQVALSATYAPASGSPNYAAKTGSPIPLLEMVKPYAFGDSYGKNTNQGADSNTLWVDRLTARHRMQSLSNFAVAGTRMDQILSSIQSSWPVNGRGLVFFADGCINDEKQYGDTSGTATTAEAFRTSLAYLTSRAFQSATGSAFVYGPGWANAASSTVGSYVDLAFNGDAAYLLVNFVTGTGGVLAVKNPAGATVASVSTGGYKQNFTGALKLAGFGAGDHSLRLSLTSGSVTVAGAIIPSLSAPNVVWLKPGQFNSNASEWSLLQAYEAACAPVLADFPTVLTVDMPADSGWDYPSMIGPDGIHPNDKGVAFITDKTEGILRAALTAYRQGVHQLTAATNSGSYTTPTVAYAASGATAPAQVTGFTATAGNQVTLAWAMPTDGGATLTGYVIQSSPAGANTWTTLATPSVTATGTVIGSGLTAGSSYDFRIAAINAIGTGTYSATATATAGQAVTTYAADTFTRADSSTLGTTETGAFAWTMVNSGWSISGNRMSVGTGTGFQNDCYVDDGQTNGTIKATRVSNPTNTGMVFRATGTGNVNGYIFWNNGGVWTLSKRTGSNSYTALGTGTGTPAAGDVVSVVLNGSTITCKVNGSTVITATDATYSGTRHGFWTQSGASSTTYDDFSHTNLTS